MASNTTEMLERIRDVERRAISNYSIRAEQAGSMGEKGLEVQLEDMMGDETGHFEESERLLREWPL